MAARAPRDEDRPVRRATFGIADIAEAAVCSVVMRQMESPAHEDEQVLIL